VALTPLVVAICARLLPPRLRPVRPVPVVVRP
jgi:hypothetical protein